MASSASFPSQQWRNYLLRMSDKEGVFDLIDSALSVAAAKWPLELQQRRAQIMEKLNAASSIDLTTSDDQDHGGNQTAASCNAAGQNESSVVREGIVKKEEPNPPMRRRVKVIRVTRRRGN